MGANRTGHHFLGAVDLGEDLARRVRGPEVSASYFEWDFMSERPNVSNGGFRLSYTEDGPYPFGPPRTFSACRAGTLGVDG